jgi:hypothetical protein
MKKFILFLVCVVVILIIGYVYFQSGNGYRMYQDPKAGYEIQIPSSWENYQNAGLYLFPTIGNAEKLPDDLYLTNNRGITLTVLTPTNLSESYSKLFINLPEVSLSNHSSDLLQIRSTDLPSADADEPSYGYTGKEYAALGKKHVYVINVFYKDSSYEKEMQGHLEKILSSLREI